MRRVRAQALVFVVRALFYSLLWSLHELEERAAQGAAGAGEAAALRERLHAYAQHCRDIVAGGATPELREEAYTSLCDLLIFFAEHLSATHNPSVPAMRALVLEPDAPLCDLLNDFVQEFVFVNHNYGMCLGRDPPRPRPAPRRPRASTFLGVRMRGGRGTRLGPAPDVTMIYLQVSGMCRSRP